jgi:hypothetical protein
MPNISAFVQHRDELERAEFQHGAAGGRLSVAMDVLTDALVLVMQHGIYCQSARQPGKPAMDVQLISLGIEHAKELIASSLEELRKQQASS